MSSIHRAGIRRRPSSAAALDAAPMFRQPEVLTEAEVVEAEAELKALQRHALELVEPKAET